MNPEKVTNNSLVNLLKQARRQVSQKRLANILGRDVRTLRRWEKSENPVDSLALQTLYSIIRGERNIVQEDTNYYGNGSSKFKFIDLFAGIGGTRLGFEAVGGKCVFTSEWDRFAVQTYRGNFGDQHEVAGDITKIDEKEIPDHDVLLAGFPCQPFSLAGVSKKNSLGIDHGFNDKIQGTLFFDLARILDEKRPKAFLLENVKNLKSHDQGRTYKIIEQVLKEDLGYDTYTNVIDASTMVPQHRERIFIVGFKEPVNFNWDAIKWPDEYPKLESILHNNQEEPENPYTRYFRGKTSVMPKYTLSDHLWNYLQEYAEKHRKKGNGFGYSVFGPEDRARTLSARYHKDGSEILIKQDRKNPRRLTPRECARLMGYPSDFNIPVSDTQAYRQFGNSIVVSVVEKIADLMAKFISDPNYAPEILVDSNRHRQMTLDLKYA